MMKIYIPSRSRADTFLAPKHTVAQLQGAWPVIVVVPWAQRSAYNDALAGSGLQKNVTIVGTRIDGIAKTRQFIAKHAKLAGDKTFFMMDDDLAFFYRADPKTTKLTNITTPRQVKEMMHDVEDVFIEGAGLVGISAREGNNYNEKSFAYNTRLIRAWGARTDAFLGCKHNRVDVMEDFDIMLQLLRKGIPNVSLYSHAQNQKQTQNPGGCSDYRTHELQDKSARKLNRLHPDFTRLRQKENKSGGEFGTRTEVTIYWKKAYASSQ